MFCFTHDLDIETISADPCVQYFGLTGDKLLLEITLEIVRCLINENTRSKLDNWNEHYFEINVSRCFIHGILLDVSFRTIFCATRITSTFEIGRYKRNSWYLLKYSESLRETESLARLVTRNKVRLNLFPRTMLPFEEERREEECKEVDRATSDQRKFHEEVISFFIKNSYRW